MAKLEPLTIHVDVKPLLRDCLEVIENASVEIEQLRAAALEIYLAGHWSRGPKTYFEDVALWEKFRDAFDIPEGTATGKGVGV